MGDLAVDDFKKLKRVLYNKHVRTGFVKKVTRENYAIGNYELRMCILQARTTFAFKRSGERYET